MNWREQYKDKIVSAEEAAKTIVNGERIVSQQFHLSAQAVLDAICDRADELRDVQFFSSINYNKEKFQNREYKDSFRYNCIFLGSDSRVSYAEGRTNLVPLHYHHLNRWLKEKYKPTTAIFAVSEPDDNGMVSLSINADYSVACAEFCDKIIVQINKYLPRTYGTQLSLDKVDYIVEKDIPLIEVPLAKINDVSLKIAENIAPYIEDGSCLQLGIGSIPDAVCSKLHDRKDLGVHTELFSDGIVDLAKEGVITGNRKQIDKGKIVSNTVCGSKKLFDFVHDNPDVLLKSVSYTNDPFVIKQNDNVISVNGCIEVDLFGQVVSDTVNGKHYSGVGGQLDFVRGAQASKNGKSFLALPSTACNGEKSRIVCTISEGTPVTVSRYDVQYLVTEYGCINVWGLSTKERAEAIISIAHPDFREKLRREAVERGIL